MLKYVFLLFLLAYLPGSCTFKQKNRENTADYELKNKEKIKYAKGFAIYRYENYFLVKLFNPFRDSRDTLHFVIGNPAEKNFSPGYQQVKAPLTNVVLLAGSHAAFLDALNKTGIVKGISSRNYFYNEKIQQHVDEGKVAELGYGQQLNTERLIVLDPQIMIFSGMSSSDVVRYSLVSAAGITLFPAAEWQESHPLGRAEWIKVFGALTGKYEASLEIFKNIERRYNALKTKPIEGEKPTVIVNAPYKDVWWLPGGKSYMSQLISDAHGRYVWANNKEEGGIQIDIETIYHKAHDADFWLNPGLSNSIEELAARDSRYREFSALKNGNVYNNNRRTNAYGGNDYYETGLLRPDIALADMIKIFHPAALPGHSLYFYRKLH